MIVTRDGSGDIHALFNVCRHRGTRLCEQAAGHFADRIQCPYHDWTYGLSGRLLAAPHMPPEFSGTTIRSTRAGCDVWDGHVFVHLGRAASFAALGPDRGCAARARAAARSARGSARALRRLAHGDLRLHRRIVYDVKANWKLIVLNYNECLHCPNLHPSLNKLHHYLGADNVAPTAGYCGGAMGFTRRRRDDERGRPPAARLSAGAQ